jgi:hypothetical protein
VLPLAASYGFEAPTAAGAVGAAVAAVTGLAGTESAGTTGSADTGLAGTASGAGEDFLAELASRVATGVAAICVVLDPGLVVLGGEVGLAGGTALAGRVAAEVGRISPAKPQVVPTGISGGPVLRGAILAAVDQARAELLASVAS